MRLVYSLDIMISYTKLKMLERGYIALNIPSGQNINFYVYINLALPE